MVKSFEQAVSAERTQHHRATNGFGRTNPTWRPIAIFAERTQVWQLVAVLAERAQRRRPIRTIPRRRRLGLPQLESLGVVQGVFCYAF
jgi:hypothetical protein